MRNSGMPQNKSMSTSTMNMQKSQNQKTQSLAPKSAKKQSSRLPEQQEPQDEKYIEKLHTHIQFLNDEGKQDDYKGQLMKMMSKDNEPFINHDISSEQKFSSMKKNYESQIAEIETLLIQTVNEIQGLNERKQYMARKLNETEEEGDEKAKNETFKIEKFKEEHDKEKKKREQLENDIQQWQDRAKRLSQDLEKQKAERREHELLKLLADTNYKEEMDINLQDKTEKEALLNLTKDKIKKLQSENQQDNKFVELMDDIDKCSKDLQQLLQQKDQIVYENKELAQLRKLAEQEKIDMAEDRRFKQMEIDKLQDLLNTEKKRNQERIEQNIQQNKSEKHQLKLRELNKLKKEAQDIKNKYKKVKDSFESQWIEMNHKQYQIELLKTENDINQKKRDKLRADLNIETEQLNQIKSELSRDIEEDQTIGKQIKDVQDDFRVQSEEFIYYMKREENYRQNVKLEEVMRSIKLDELVTTSQQNTQEHWENMQQFSLNK